MGRSATASSEDQRRFRENLREFRESVLAYDGPTDERLAHAGFEAEVVDFDDPLRIGADGKPTNSTVARKRVRMKDDPLERLASRKLLCPGDEVRNAAMAAAAAWYRETHRNGGGEPLKAHDPAKPFCGAGGALSYFRTDWQIDQFAKWVEAREAITSAFQVAVDSLVLYDQALADIGRKISHHSGRTAAAAVALEFVRCGIEDIAIHRGMFDRKR